ncbi:hypothetical protein [Pleurocapsa sp. PCC 7319]|uniref:hypothetical protein n=1 Tax=Pleurocapsa sp. PCC 7319 TaxID=118161 RepID=UPI0003452595|nr:hypothetical protein [Pleurocapsa sp. PCC 7319]
MIISREVLIEVENLKTDFDELSLEAEQIQKTKKLLKEMLCMLVFLEETISNEQALLEQMLLEVTDTIQDNI